jgi:hypothetical protein
MCSEIKQNTGILKELVDISKNHPSIADGLLHKINAVLTDSI